MTPPKNILVATDFSEAANIALEHAMDIARSSGAKLIVVHAYEIPVYPYPDAFVPTPPGLASQIEEAARKALHDLCNRQAARGVSIEPVLCEGRAWREIQRVADERNVDLIVIGTHGRTGVARVMLGSVAEKVVRTSTHPVLVVPSKTTQ